MKKLIIGFLLFYIGEIVLGQNIVRYNFNNCNLSENNNAAGPLKNSVSAVCDCGIEGDALNISGQDIEFPIELDSFFKNDFTLCISLLLDNPSGEMDIISKTFKCNADTTLSISYRASDSFFIFSLREGFNESVFLAAKADPTAELYYNDYNNEQPAKRAGTIALIKKLQTAGIKVDGVGIQGHWSLNSNPEKDVEDAIIEYSKLGIKVAFTELDITVIPNPWELQGADVKQNFNDYVGDPKMNPYPNGLPEDIQQKLAQKYENLFKIFLKHKDKISRITFWGLGDSDSWLNNWPIRGRTNYPLLFDINYEKKPAYSAVLKAK